MTAPAPADAPEFVSRYDALGHYPNPDTMCPGDCDGMGVHPEPKTGVALARVDAFLAKAFPWEVRFLRWVQGRIPADAMRRKQNVAARVYRYIDGLVDHWDFVTCATCNGTGLRPPGTRVQPSTADGILLSPLPPPPAFE
jgi:hypothetical protein